MARICWFLLLKAVCPNFQGTWLRKAKLNSDWSEFVKINVLTRKYIYNVPSEIPTMFLNFISKFNEPKPNTDTLKEFDMSKILRHNIDKIQRLWEIGKIKFCCYHSCICPCFALENCSETEAVFANNLFSTVHCGNYNL